jgi:MraZ protein
MIFRGRHEYTIDPKGRVNIPSPYRDLLQESGQESLVITNFDNCIYGYSAEGWEKVERELSKLPSTDQDINDFLRYFVGGSVEVVPDKQGRILIPPSLRAYAGLEKDIVIIGMLKRFEIWSVDRWTEVITRFEKKKQEDPVLAQRIASIEF